jgi:hypothetical protein
MSTVAQIEAAILELPQDSFLELFSRMSARRESMAFEPPEMEAELLKAVNGPWHLVDDAFWDSIRQSWPSHQKAAQCQG